MPTHATSCHVYSYEKARETEVASRAGSGSSIFGRDTKPYEVSANVLSFALCVQCFWSSAHALHCGSIDQIAPNSFNRRTSVSTRGDQKRAFIDGPVLQPRRGGTATYIGVSDAKALIFSVVPTSDEMGQKTRRGACVGDLIPLRPKTASMGRAKFAFESKFTFAIELYISF